MNALAEVLVEWGVRSSALLGSVLVILAVTQRASAAWRNAICVGGLLGCLILPVVTLSLTPWKVLPRSDSEQTPVEQVFVPLKEEAVPERWVPQSPSAPSVRTLEESVSAIAIPKRSMTTESILVLVWGLGAVIMLGLWMVGEWRVSRLRRRSLRFAWESILPVGASDSVRGPMLVGWKRPFLLVPPSAEAWGREERALVLAHEQAHLERGDLWWMRLGALVRVLQWWNPLVHLVCRCLNRESEEACDDRVLRAGVSPADYARVLLERAREAHGEGERAALAMAKTCPIENRLHRILATERSLQGLRWSGIAVFGGCLLPLIFASGLIAMEERHEVQLELEGSEDTVTIDANMVVGDTKQGIMRFTEGVVLLYRDIVVKADALTLTTNGDAKLFEAEGVTITGPDELRATCQRLWGDLNAFKVRLQGGFVLQWSGRELRAKEENATVTIERKRSNNTWEYTTQGAVDIFIPRNGAPEKPPAPGESGFLGIIMRAAIVTVGGRNMGAVLVDDVLQESSAEAAGIQRGDRLYAIDGEELPNKDLNRKNVGPSPALRLFKERIASQRPGDSVRLTLMREGESIDVEVILGKRSAEMDGEGVLESSEPDIVYQSDEVDERPKPIKAMPPRYPSAMKRAGRDGRVVLSLVVDKEGKVAEATILKSADQGFNLAALEAVKKWRFKPAQFDGQPAACRILQPISFRLEGDGD